MTPFTHSSLSFHSPITLLSLTLDRVKPGEGEADGVGPVGGAGSKDPQLGAPEARGGHLGLTVASLGAAAVLVEREHEPETRGKHEVETR